MLKDRIWIAGGIYLGIVLGFALSKVGFDWEGLIISLVISVSFYVGMWVGHTDKRTK